MHCDLELAGGSLVHVGDELGDVLGVEIRRRICRGQIPLGLRASAQRKREAERGDEHAYRFHRDLLRVESWNRLATGKARTPHLYHIGWRAARAATPI